MRSSEAFVNTSSMAMALELFERIVRNSPAPNREVGAAESYLHPFDNRNIHSHLPSIVRELFDNGHYAEATFAAFKYVDNTVKRHADIEKTGEALMMDAFDPNKPKIALNGMGTMSEKDEQRGFRFLFTGGAVGIRNPAGHEIFAEDVEDCLDRLAFASMLLRRLEQAGYQ